MRTTRLRSRDVLLPTASLIGLIVLWWASVVAFGIPAYLLPSPVTVSERLLHSPGLYARNALVTLEKIVVGGTIGVTLGGGLAVVTATNPAIRRTVYPYLVAARVTPKIAVAPVFLLYVGTGFSTAVVFVALIAFFPMVVSTAAGLENVPSEIDDLLASINASPRRAFLTVRVPYALPDVFAGLKQSLTLSVIGAVVAEWIVASKGLGYLILFASEEVRPDIMLAAVTMLFVEGLFLYGGVVLVQRRVPWLVERS